VAERPKIFISHVSDERILADAWKELIGAVSSGFIRVWYSSDKNPTGGMTLGNQWFDELYQKIKESELILAIQTPASTGRPWIMWECGIASGMDKLRSIMTIVYTMKPGDLTMPLTNYQIYQGDDEASVLEVCKRLVSRYDLDTRDYTYEAAIKKYFERINSHFLLKEVSAVLPNKRANVELPRKNINPEQIKVWHKQFEDYVQAGRIKELNTQRQLMYVSLGKPVDLAIHTMLGQILLKHEDFQAALEELNHALEFTPNDVFLLYQKALTLAELHEFILARQIIDTIVSMDIKLDKNVEIAALQGRIYRELWRETTNDPADLEKAFQAYYKAYQANKMSYYAGINTAELAFIKGDEAFAAKTFREVLEICQQFQSQKAVSYWVDFSSGEAYLGLGEIDTALADYKQGLKRNPAPGPRELSSALGGILRLASARKLPNEVIDNFVEAIKTLFKLS
jgi:tetratricopeptide (TPR) repeat protein